MKVYSNENEWNGNGSAVVFGMFDGVHIGHQKLIEKACSLARANGLESIAYTFSTHPMDVLRPDQVHPRLDTIQEKTAKFSGCGLDAAILRPFTLEYASMPKEEFIWQAATTLKARYFIVGFNYTFGDKGSGNSEDMARLAAQYHVETVVVDRVELEGETVSSTNIRRHLQEEGDAERAMQMLGQPYMLSGVVSGGKHLGRTIGYPTANIAVPAEKLLPKRGVYACAAIIGEKRYKAAVNIGSHPTAPEGAPTIEAFLLDYPGTPIYGQEMKLQIVSFIRPEKKFPSLDALTVEIAQNCESVREILDGYPELL